MRVWHVWRVDVTRLLPSARVRPVIESGPMRWAFFNGMPFYPFTTGQLELFVDSFGHPIMVHYMSQTEYFQYMRFSVLEDEEDDSHANFLGRTTIGNGCFCPPESIFDWTAEDSDLSNQNTNNQAFSGKHWRLLQCQNRLRIFEELLDVDFLVQILEQGRAVGVVEASCEEIFELMMSMDTTRFDIAIKANMQATGDCSFQYGSLVEKVDGHTAILHHELQLDWCVWPSDLCYVHYWRRNDDGSYVVLFRSREHENYDPQHGFVRTHVESGGFNISPLKPQNGSPRTQVQHLMQIDLKGWGVGYISSFQ
ncbi:hypothetical protein TEA_014255 [Camellia sinensis var. sinensis]|uniref:START domain-containing protein n=1 Tax=Camellia sinensis var. sinensis TaxID=542762 RepID=A0A4S4DWV0_CAMSN|nr:hypothetical protein TEA_014255 [Camellia sinensis var. sinensis]